ncbi:DnaJ domain-containing protein [Pantanalinema sp. GBBB05]|uniref:J domain-containing protein n=1 Tax=Pantanalinema sp. GBBB05 TaxID=2604139 RepID=UPI001D949B21|nr:DnaJ domain-containing protein [Pantanalinema sp. GBBB05]
MPLSLDTEDFRHSCTTLNVSPRASLKEIKVAYRQMARLYHPDLNPQKQDAEEALKEINIAYEKACHYLSRSCQQHSVMAEKLPTGKQMAADRTTQKAVYSTFVDALFGNFR